MKSFLAALAACLFIVAVAIEAASAREAVERGVRPTRGWTQEEFAGQPTLVPFPVTEGAVDTYTIVYYSFDNMNWQGWTRLDRTAQVDTFWHVEDYLEPELSGLPGPIEGSKSAWCGGPPGPSDYLCGWRTAPGYGNGWDQSLVTWPIIVSGLVTISFHGYFDCEEDEDFVYVEYDQGMYNWQPLAAYTGVRNVTAVHSYPATTSRTKLRFHFVSDGAWSDEDGFYASNGAAHVDSITISDATGILDFEDFESAADNAKSCGRWKAEPARGYGTYSGLRANLNDKDPCAYNMSSQIVFFVGNEGYPSSEYPGLYNTPFCRAEWFAEEKCQHEWVVSPVIDLTKFSTGNNENQDAEIPAGEIPGLGGTKLSFTVYRDLPLSNLVFYQWYVTAVGEDCPNRRWQTTDPYWYGDDQTYSYRVVDASAWIGSSRHMQVALGVRDMCSVWYLVNGDCAEHTPSPWFDNVKVQKFRTEGPQWGYRDFDLFQDNFPVEASPPWGAVRADMARDIKDPGSAGIDPGDSIVVDCASPMGGGIDTMPNGLPAVYLHVNAHWIGAGAPPLGAVINGLQLQGTYGEWQGTDVGGWDIVQCERARAAGMAYEGRYMVDLDDSLFVPGYEIDYYFTAVDNAAVETALPKWARSTGPYFEFTCLPTGNSDILYVDDFSGRGSWAGAAENYWMSAFDAVLPPGNQPDRYDVNGPASFVSNGPGSRANAALLRNQYYLVVWDSGDLQRCTISDGTTSSDKSNDCQLLIDWMSQADHFCGLWVCGDDVAYDLDQDGSVPALTLMETWCGVQLVNTSYFDVTGGVSGGGVVRPLITGDSAGGVFVAAGVPDRFYLDGGCWILNMFDCLETTGNGAYSLDYPLYEGNPYYAGIQSQSTNEADQTVRTMWFGFSMMYTRDYPSAAYTRVSASDGGPIDRFEIVSDVFQWMSRATNPDVTHTEVPKAYGLTQNYPNPFNPSTTVRYDMKEKGLVTVKVYSVAGQLVRTLVSEMKEPGSYTAVWDGKNSLGADAASGIYFCKMETAGFSATKKMVLLR